MNKKELAIVRRAKKTVLGRVLCRVMGEETGAVMMEYVVVATLIAAAVAAGAWFFGKDIMNMFGVAGRATTGDDTGAVQMRGKAKEAEKAGHSEANTRNDAWIETPGESKAKID